MVAYALIAAFCVSFALGLVLVTAMRRLAPRIGLVDHPGGRKQHQSPTPLGGGIAIFLATSLPLLGAVVVAWIENRWPGRLPIPAAILPYVQGAVVEIRRAAVILVGGLLMMSFGLVDDYVAFRPTVKLLCQIVLSLVIVLLAPLRITIYFADAPVQIIVTTLWLVCISNAFNLLDNMDGLSSTIAFFIGLGMMIVALQTGQLFIAGFLLTLMGTLCAFLVFNFPPASIFMGDCGSLFIGYFLGVATVLATFVTSEQTNPLFPILVPAILFAVPIYDTLSVFAIRFHHGKSILAGDRNHFSHRLLRMGMSPRRVLFTVALITMATSLGATAPYGSDNWRIIVPLVQAIAFVSIIAQLELEASEVKWDGHPKEK